MSCSLCSANFVSRDGVRYLGADLGALAGAGLESRTRSSNTTGLCLVLRDAFGSVCAPVHACLGLSVSGCRWILVFLAYLSASLA